MKNRYFLFMIFFYLSIQSYGQNEIDTYKKIYKTADSLKAIGKVDYMDSDSLFIKIKETEQKHPSAFVHLIEEYMLKSKFNEASFVYFLSFMRLGYYNDVINNYNEKNLFNHLTNNYGGYINHYLRTDIDNYISIMKMAIKYYLNNDYTFFSKDNNIEKFNLQTVPLNNFILDFEKNKVKFSKDWKTERSMMEKEIKKNQTIKKTTSKQ